MLLLLFGMRWIGSAGDESAGCQGQAAPAQDNEGADILGLAYAAIGAQLRFGIEKIFRQGDQAAA